MSVARLTGLYVCFAIVSTLANLGTQGLLHLVVPPEPGVLGLAYWFALAAGTGVGLVVKYVLDKRWVFGDHSTGVATHGRKFGLYSLMGVATTVIFWGTQSAFFAIWGTPTMLYLGGGIGLAVGYVVKYQLDKRYVFTPTGERWAGRSTERSV